MNKIGVHFGYWNRNWNVDYTDTIKRAATLNLDILEIAPGPLLEISKEKRYDIRETAKECGIELTYSIGLGREYDIACEDENTRQNGLQYSKKILEVIGEMDGHTYSGINYSSWNKTFNYGVECKEAYFERSAKSLQELMKLAKEHNIMYCFESVNRFEQYLINTAAEAVKLVEMVDHPNAKILLDTFHMNIEETSFVDAIKTAGKYLGHVHVGEANRRPPCEGRMPWEAITGALKDINYQNAIVMEPFVKMGGEVGRDIKVWRDISKGADENKMDQEIREAILFINNKMK
jgi:D-psicose/D-tagatose/L-ribulose 3-epimerase